MKTHSAALRILLPGSPNICASKAPSSRSRILYLDHIEGEGRLLFDQIVAMDMEGIVCKRKDSRYKVRKSHRATGSRSRIHDIANWNGVKSFLIASETLCAPVHHFTHSTSLSTAASSIGTVDVNPYVGILRTVFWQLSVLHPGIQ